MENFPGSNGRLRA